uniref:Protein hook n=1 Tax=Strigamia maritima TaxID=126957 RepID=T1J5Q8_STRMM
MEKHKLCQSLMTWLRTFNVSAPHSTAEELSDGVAMAEVLSQVAPDWFDSLWLSKLKTSDVSNWRLKVSNLRKILKSIQDYYQEVLGQQITEFTFPDLNAIAENNDSAELGRLLQLILGCVVNCDRKQEYIEVIMGMEEVDQHEVMNAIQELMSTSAIVSSSSDLGSESEQNKRLSEQLQDAIEAKEHITQRCHELDLQVAMLQEDKTTLESENDKLLYKLTQLEDFDDMNTSAGKKYQKLQQQVEILQEEVFKLETNRDEYRLKSEDFEKRFMDVQGKNDEMQKKLDDARQLKDEVDILRETADKADLKKSTSLKSRIEVYKKQIFELHNKVLEETKRADVAEFESKRTQDKLVTLEKEKERIIAERDAIKETVDELKLSLLEIENSKKPASVGSSDSDILDSVPPEIKEKLIRLQHENKMFKLNVQSNNEEVLQCMLDDARQHESELQMENRLVNQRVLELQGQLEDLQMHQTDNSNQRGSEIGQKLSSLVDKIKSLETELQNKSTNNTELEAQLNEKEQQMTTMLESLHKKEDDMRGMEERYKKYLGKAQSIIRVLDSKQSSDTSNGISTLKSELQQKEKTIAALKKESEKQQKMRDVEERLIASSFHLLGKQLQRKVVAERLTHTQGAQPQTFLARQRQATSRKIGGNLPQSLFL